MAWPIAASDEALAAGPHSEAGIYWEWKLMGGRLHASQHLHPPPRRRHPSGAGALAAGDSRLGCFLEAAEDGLLRQGIYESAVPLVRQFAGRRGRRRCRFLPRPPAEPRNVAAVPASLPTGHCSWTSRPPACPPHYDEVTLIGALGGGKLALFVNGINLDQFPAYVAQFPLLVTFNGSQFDVPFLRVHFPKARLDQAHIDLRFVLRSLGYRGGLKAIERSLGLTRDAAIEGVDGFEAVRLWHRYRRGDRAALMKLALYNLTDVVNLVELVQIAVCLHHERLAFPGEMPAGEPQITLKYDPEYLGAWIVQELGSGG